VRQVRRQRHPPRLVVLDVHGQIHRPIYRGSYVHI
jgi:hypothetical protein